jgi:RimJ/RimL family protein N-acetyltransferase
MSESRLHGCEAATWRPRQGWAGVLGSAEHPGFRAYMREDRWMDIINQLWPVGGLRICVNEYELKLPSAEQLYALIRDRSLEVAMEHSLNERHQQFALLQGELRAIADWLPQRWRLSLAIVFRGEPVGFQTLLRFSSDAVVTTDSWISQNHRGMGHGKAARRAVLLFARDYLGATRAIGSSWSSNAASNALNRSLGYVEESPSQGSAELRWHLNLLTWKCNPPPSFVVHGWSNEVQFLLGVS